MTTWAPKAKQVEVWAAKAKQVEVWTSKTHVRVFSPTAFARSPTFATGDEAGGFWTTVAAP